MLSAEGLVALWDQRSQLLSCMNHREDRIGRMSERVSEYPLAVRHFSEKVLAAEEARLNEEEDQLAALNRSIDELLAGYADELLGDPEPKGAPPC